MKNRADLAVETSKRGTVRVVFADVELLPQIDFDHCAVPIVAIVDDADTLPSIIRSLDAFPSLSHFITAQMLATPIARPHLAMLLERLEQGVEQTMLGASGVGRVARLAQASRREARFERIHAFFAKHGLSDRTIGALSEIAEELVMNALYDAPFEAGYFKTPVPRTDDVELPADRACEISYGIENGNAFVRLRDTFGALSRARLISVLNRCSAKTVTLDESRGGAGLGLWRVFAVASTLAISVIPGVLTDIVVGIATKDGRLSKQQLAVHLFFANAPKDPFESLIPDDDSFDKSVTLVLVA